MTVDGDAVAHAEERNGADRNCQICDVIEFCGGYKAGAQKDLNGRTYDGQSYLLRCNAVVKEQQCDPGVLQGTGMVKEETACINCGRCHQACPFGLIPTALAKAYEARDAQALSDLKVMQCMELRQLLLHLPCKTDLSAS